MLFGFSRGEIMMIAAISALIMLSGLIPKIARALTGERAPAPSRPDVE